MQRLLDHRILRVLLFLAGFAMALEGCKRDRLSAPVMSTAQAQTPGAPVSAAFRLVPTNS